MRKVETNCHPKQGVFCPAKEVRSLRRTFRAIASLSPTATQIVFLAAFVLLFGLPAFSQNCALCYTQAASSGARMIQALKSGILVLIIPPTLMSVGMIFIVRQKRSQFKRSEAADDSGQDW